MDRISKLQSRGLFWRLVLGLAFVAAAMGVLLSIGLTSAQETRHYYIAADEVEWDYAPGGNLVDPSFDEAAAVFLEGGPDRIGSTYVKAVYREYTDDTFSTLKPRAPEWEHLGLLGPVLRAEVGDTIAVHFKNNTSFPASVHPHGVFYNKDSEGAPYNDGTSGADRADDAVAPGETHTYLWQVPERAGPGPMDPSSVMWSYHSHVDEAGDTNAGLIGPMIITAKGKARKDGSPKGVDREFVAVYSVFDENRSLYIDNNIETFLGMDPSEAEELKADDEFNESNLMHGINGYVYGNLPGLTMRKGERVRWYMMGMGTEVDLHTPHWHGQTLVQNGMRTDVTELLPMSMKVADMVPDNPGTWFFHCHVNDHIDAGMMAMFTVQS